MLPATQMKAFPGRHGYYLALLLLLLLSSEHAHAIKYTDAQKANIIGYNAYDVTHYDLSVRVDTADSSISGICKIKILLLKRTRHLLVDLFPQYEITELLVEGEDVLYARDSHHVAIRWDEGLPTGAYYTIKIAYYGKPPIAKNPPWNGGFVWRYDSLNRPFIGVACQGLGASSWYPCKDVWHDKADSASIAITPPPGTLGVANGRFIGTTHWLRNTPTYHYKVSYPINIYNITFYAGHYKALSFKEQKGNRALPTRKYYVLDYNEKSALPHLQEADTMLLIYGRLFGRYPFWQDGYNLVEAPYWGMEHQSAIAYGNNFNHNAYGFDFILVHESGHEWWGNSVSGETPRDMWIHESFTTYAESLFLEKTKSREKALTYLAKQRLQIENKHPIIPQGQDDEYEDTDQYYKGAWILHTLRSLVDKDTVWFDAIIKLQEDFQYKVVPSGTFLDSLTKVAGIQHQSLLLQYLYTTKLPELKVKVKDEKRRKRIMMEWSNIPKGAQLPFYYVLDKQLVRSPAKDNKLELTLPLGASFQDVTKQYILTQ